MSNKKGKNASGKSKKDLKKGSAKKKGMFNKSGISKKAKNSDKMNGPRKALSGVKDSVLTGNYYWIAKSGAAMMTLTFDVDGTEHKEMLCIQSGDAKNNRNYYINQRTKEEVLLPGYEIMNALTNNVYGKDIEALEGKFEKKKVKQYSAAKKKEVTEDALVLVKLNGAKVKLAFKREAVDIPMKDKKGKIILKKGKNIPSGKFYVESSIHKVFNKKGLTQVEISNGDKKPAYMKAFEKQKPYIADRTIGKKWSKKFGGDGSPKGKKGKKGRSPLG